MWIRPTTEDDLSGIGAILEYEVAHRVAHFAARPPTLDELREQLRTQPSHLPWIVATDEGDPPDSVLGYAMASAWKSRCAYDWTAEIGVYVRKDRHRTGVGRALVEELIRRLERAGIRTLLAGITLPNPASQGLFERLEFEPVGVFPKVGFKHGSWRDVGYWARHLGDGPPAGHDGSPS